MERGEIKDAAPPPPPTKPQQRDLEQASRIFEAWIRRRVPGAEDAVILNAHAPTGAGVANETILVEAEQTVDGRRQPRGYVIRVDTSEHLFMGMDLQVHYRMYETLNSEPAVPTPRVLGFEADRSLIGERFFVMERVEGRVPPDRPHYADTGWVTELTLPQREKMWRDIVTMMARMHALPREKFAFLERPDMGRTGLEQLLNHWLAYAKWCGGDRYDVVRRGGAWLADHLPGDIPTGLSWGDARAQNVMFRDGEIVAVFDWDMVSLAGAETDLAWWITAQQGTRQLAGFGNGRQTVELWESLSGRSARHMDWHMAFMAFQLTVIMIRLPTLLHRQGLIDDAGLAAYVTHPGARLASLLDLPWEGPPLPPPARWDE